MKTCQRCGKKKENVGQMGVDNYLGWGNCASWHYFACEECAYVIGCHLGNSFIEFSLDWKKPPTKTEKVTGVFVAP